VVLTKVKTKQIPFHKRFAREITLILIVKVVVILLMKWAFFSAPINVSDTPDLIEKQFGLPAQETHSTHP